MTLGKVRLRGLESRYRKNKQVRTALHAKLNGGLIRTTYEIITPESAEDGEAAERGWLDEEGTHYSVSAAIRLLEGTEPSSSQFHDGIWYTATGDTDYSDGSVTNHSYHLKDWPLEAQRKVYQAVKPRGYR